AAQQSDDANLGRRHLRPRGSFEDAPLLGGAQGAAGVPLQPFEVPPVYGDPDIDRCAFTCERCKDAMTGGPLGPAEEWRILETTAWSQVPAAQVCVVRLLRRLANDQIGWAQAFLEDLYVDPAIDEWVAKE
ncbi:MAG: hypothetical protein AAF581_14045, partial [Planctomycetota bacterium]